MQQAVTEFGDAAADIAEPDHADGLALGLVADQRIAVDVPIAPQRPIGLQDALRQGDQHAERMFGHRIGVSAGLVDDKHTRLGTGVDIDRIEARAVGRYDQQVRRPLQQILVGMEMPRQLIACRADLVGVGVGQNGRKDLGRALVLEPVEPHVGPILEDFNVDIVGEIFDVEDALVVNRHILTDFQFGKS